MSVPVAVHSPVSFSAYGLVIIP